MILGLWRAFSALPRGWHYLAGLIAAVALLAGLYAYLAASENADDRRNQDIGRDIQNAENTAHTLDQLERANDAETKLDRDADARLANCRLHSRTPENCRP